MTEHVVAGRRVVNASAVEIFAVLADPAQHSVLDGSGMIRGMHHTAAPKLTLGTLFEMRMQQAGTRYRIVSEVVEFDEPNLIAWQVHPARYWKRLRELLVGGHRWRYRLSETNEGTLVEEEFDYSQSRSPWVIKLLRFPTRNTVSIERTLDHLQARFS